MILSLIPWQAKAGAAVVAAGAIFAGGIKLEGWRDAEALGKEKLAHAADVAKLQHDWSLNLEAEHKVADQAQAELETERLANQIARENADAVYQKRTIQLQAQADRNVADSVRIAADARSVRDELAAAIAAAGAANGGGQVSAPDVAARCTGAGGHAACGFLQRCNDLLVENRQLLVGYAAMAERKQAVIVETRASWPKN